MNRKQKKIYLGRVHNLKSEIEETIRRYEMAMTEATHITQTINSNPGSGRGSTENKLERAVLKMCAISDQQRKKIRLLAQTRKEVSEAIAQLHKPQYRLLLTLRYIDCMTIYEIAFTVGISEKNAAETINRAIDAIRL